MTAALSFLLLITPFAVAAAIGFAAHRSGSLRLGLDQFWPAAPMAGRIHISDDDRDLRRIQHDVDAIRTRFEQRPAWPASGALGERR